MNPPPIPYSALRFGTSVQLRLPRSESRCPGAFLFGKGLELPANLRIRHHLFNMFREDTLKVRLRTKDRTILGQALHKISDIKHHRRSILRFGALTDFRQLSSSRTARNDNTLSATSKTWRILGAWDVSSQRCILALRPLHGNQTQESHRDDGIASNVPCPVVIVTCHVSRGIKCNTAPCTQENSDKRVGSSPADARRVRLVTADSLKRPVPLRYYLALPMMSPGIRARVNGTRPNMRGGRCRSSAARANCRPHNGLHRPSI